MQHPTVAGRALPGQRADNRGPLLQGHSVSGLDVDKARRLAQGFDERLMEVMLHSRKDSMNASYQGYGGRFCPACAVRNLDPYEVSIMEIVGFVDGCRREKSWAFMYIFHLIQRQPMGF